jgi:hypothetical protein
MVCLFVIRVGRRGGQALRPQGGEEHAAMVCVVIGRIEELKQEVF